MYFGNIRELFPMRSDGLGRALACILAAVVCGEIGGALGGFLGPLLFLPLPESDVAWNRTAMLAMALFLLFGSGGVLLGRRLTAGLPESELKEPKVGRITGRTRWLVIATALVVAVTTWSGFGLGSVLYPSALIVGALVQPRSQRYGFWMMFVPAVFLSAWMLPFGCFLLFDAVRTINLYHHSTMAIVASPWGTSLLLLACCDAALIKEGFKMRLLHR
jgi:MFS family permease